MAFILGFVLATLGVVFCIAGGLLLLFIPRWRHLAPYAFLIYPSAYACGVFCLAFFGFLVGGNLERSHSNVGDWIAVLLIFGLAALGAVAGAIFGLAWANRIWWRFFAGPSQQTGRPQATNLLALTPFLSSTLRSNAQAATSHDRDEYQDTA